MAVKNMAASVLSRLKKQAKEEKIPFQMILQLFCTGGISAKAVSF